MTTQSPLTAFVTKHNVRMTVKQTDSNPAMDLDGNMDHWRCRLRCGGRSMSLTFSQGYGHEGEEPTIESVLDCLASDASSIESARGFEDWAADLGMDPDSRKALRTFRLIERQTDKLRSLIGPDAYRELLDTERL
jgi:hypothetical protein